MKIPHSFLLVFSAAMALVETSTVSAQQSFQLSSKFLEARFSGKQQLWNGQHRFGNVFCLTFPRANDADALAEAMYNNNTLYFSRAAFNDMTAIFVVASTVPAGRSVEVEIGNLSAQNQKGVEAYPRNFSQSQANGVLGPSLVLTVRNAKEGEKGQVFPFVRPVDTRADAPLMSLSVHRLFVHERDRIEVAGLRYFKVPVSADKEAQAVSELSALIEQAAESLQSCTTKLPSRVQRKDGDG
ncbi:hypothetical protein [Rhodoferax sp.]|uniref:hypothetical protein n=1 Tax=Rhodoferax sp. TaxID=50421 RepID=UPI00374CB922